MKLIPSVLEVNFAWNHQVTYRSRETKLAGKPKQRHNAFLSIRQLGE